MFLISINFVVCFFIVSSNCIPLPNSNDKQTKTVSAEVDDRIKGFSKFRDMLSKELDKGEFWGKLKMMAEQFIRAEKKLETVIEEKGILGAEKGSLARYKNLAVVRTRVEQLEKELYPKDQLYPRNRYDRWRMILRAKNFHAQQIRRRVEQEYGYDNPLDSHHEFAAAIQKIYGDLNLAENSPYNVVDNAVLEILRTDSEDAKKLFDLLGVNYDDKNRKALKILAEPFMLPSTKMMDVSPLKDLDTNVMRYIIIRPAFYQFKTSQIKDSDISKFFQGIPMRSLDIKPVQIIAEFKDETTAIMASNSCPSLLKGTVVGVQLSEYPESSTIPPKGH